MNFESVGVGVVLRVHSS